jgi:hypothetical protein
MSWVFHLWHQFQWGEIDWRAWIQKELRLRVTILRDHPSTEKKARGIAKHLFR